MADVIPTKRGTSGRKQWTLHDCSGNSLKRLRNHLANDGCAESQVVLAKQLLEEHSDNQEENAKLGVYWLIKASEQGNKEATTLLKQCLIDGKGITEHNFIDVKTCIEMTQNEKIARKAAREMFACLSKGDNYITTIQLQKTMLEIEQHEGDVVASSSSLQQHEEIDWNRRSTTNEYNEKLTEDHLIDAAVNYTQGLLPIDLNLHIVTQRAALKQVNLINKLLVHLKIFYFNLLRFVADLRVNSELDIVYLMVIYALINTEIIIIPIIIYYVTIIIMIVVTCKMLQCKIEYYDFTMWSRLFLTYSGGELNASQAEYQFLRNNLKPYANFFLALLINLIIYPIISEQFIPQSELTIVSFVMTFITLYGFMYKKRDKLLIDYWILFSFSVNVLAKYPYDTDPVVTQGWRFLDLKIPSFASYVIGNGIDFCINFRILLYALIPLIFIKIAIRENYRGVYKFLIPHCVSLSWLQIVIISSQGATMFGLIRGTLALVGVVLFLPLLGVTSLILPLFALTKYLYSNDYIYTLGLFTISCYTLTKTRVKLLQCVLILLTSYLIIVQINHGGNQAISTLTYDDYHQLCGDGSNLARMQIECEHLNDFHVSWDGYVDTVKIRSIRNNFKLIIDKLPTKFAHVLGCYFGEEVRVDKLTKCSLKRYNVYDFDVRIRMKSSIWTTSSTNVLLLSLPHEFVNFTMKLTQNDHVWFKGALSEAGNVRPRIAVTEMGCLGCQNVDLNAVKANQRDVLSDIVAYVWCGLRTLLNFIFFPLIEFK